MSRPGCETGGWFSWPSPAVHRCHTQTPVDRFDARGDAQPLGLHRIVASELREFTAEKVQAVVELRLGRIGAAGDAHGAVDARLRLRPGVGGIDLSPQLRPAAGETVQRAALVFDATMRGNRRGRWCEAAHSLATDELEHGAQRAFGLSELAQEAARGVDLGARVVHTRDDHPAGLDLGVERLEVRALREDRRWFDVKRGADVVAHLLAQLDFDTLGAACQRGVGGQEDGRDEVAGVARAAAHDAADGLAEEQVGALDGRVGGEDQARDVDALADHVDCRRPG
jgi:hypothetical protein